MRNLFANVILFAALSVAFSALTACNNTASTQKGPVIEVASNESANVAAPNTAVAETKDSKFPPVPTGLYQAAIKDLDGNEYTLEDKKGKVVLVNLWAIWCGPCIAEMPHLREMQENIKTKVLKSSD